MDNTADDRYVPRDALNGQKAKAAGLVDACVTHLRAQVKRLETGLKTIERYTGDTRHPNGVWDAHVIAGRLLRGEDQNGRLPNSGETEHG